MIKKLLTLGLALALTMSFGACHKKQGEYAGVDGDFVNGTPLPDRIEGSNFFGNSVERGQFPAIYFGFDSFEVSSEEKPKIEKVASTMQSEGKTLIVAGFTDERGTPEYNRGLGEKRAQAVRDSLIAAGLSADKIQTVSFGAEMPADPGSGDAAWAKNRRAEFGVVK